MIDDAQPQGLPKTKKRSPLIIFFASLLWAGDNPFRKPLLVGGLSVPFVSFLEHLISSIASLPGLFRQRSQWSKLTKLQIFGLIYIGAGASALGALLFVQSAVVMNYNFTVAALLQKLQPIFAIILAVLFLKEKLHPKFWIFALPALIGAYLVTFGWASPAALFHSSGGLNLLGPVLAVLAAILWAGGTVVGRSLLKNLHFEFVNGARFVFGLIFLFIFMLATRGFQFSLMTPFFWRNVIIISLVTGFFALLFYYYGLKGTKASVATLMELGYPLALTVVNWKFLGNTLSAWQIFGAIILLGSVTFLVITDNGNENQILENEKGV